MLQRLVLHRLLERLELHRRHLDQGLRLWRYRLRGLSGDDLRVCELLDGQLCQDIRDQRHRLHQRQVLQRIVLHGLLERILPGWLVELGLWSQRQPLPELRRRLL
jgi:hypothetical protein